MESKDLVLLMLIPVILISLIVYTDTTQITGAVTQEQKKESNILGTYSIMPSFKAKIDYDLNDYNKINEQFNFILSCTQNKDIKSCIDDINYDNGFMWELGCDKGAEKILYDFAEFLQDCFDSDDNNCLCKKDMNISKENIQKFELTDKKFKISQAVQSQKIEILMSEPKVDISYTIKLNGNYVWYPNPLIIDYTKDKVVLNMIFKDEIDKTIEYNDAFPNKKDITLYKSEINNLNTIDFVDIESDELIYPNYPNRKRIKSVNLHPCQLKPKNMYKFCVTKKDYKIVAYDKIDRQVKERPLTIKFAAYIPLIES